MVINTQIPINLSDEVVLRRFLISIVSEINDRGQALDNINNLTTNISDQPTREEILNIINKINEILNNL